MDCKQGTMHTGRGVGTPLYQLKMGIIPTMPHFIVPGKPQPKQRARKGKYGNFYTPKETVAYEHKVGVFARKAHLRSRPDKVQLGLVIWWADARRHDGDNVLKAIQDALNHIAWNDDNQVVKTNVDADHIDRKNPRVEVAIDYLEPSHPAAIGEEDER